MNTSMSTLQIGAGRQWFWSVRRELWENRGIYLGPMIVAGLLFLFFLYHSVRHLSEKMKDFAAMPPAGQAFNISGSYGIIAILVTLTAITAAWFYCLDSLFTERRDRSILFWKSLPVSDLNTVLAKAAIPFLFVPVFTFLLVLATQLLMLVSSALILLIAGDGAGLLWERLPVAKMVLDHGYFLFTLTLWYAPIYGIFMVISVLAPRATFLWAVLPPLLLSVAERLIFDTTEVFTLVKDRVVGSVTHAFSVQLPVEVAAPAGRGMHMRVKPMEAIQALLDPVPDPAKFFGSMDVWGGIAVGLVLIAAAVWLRRKRDPI